SAPQYAGERGELTDFARRGRPRWPSLLAWRRDGPSRARRPSASAEREGRAAAVAPSVAPNRLPQALHEQSPAQRAGLCRVFVMGRAGLEPATLGLKVPCSTS